MVAGVEETLHGGNTHDRVVRIGRTVRRPTGYWTPGVHALLEHLAAKRFNGAPRVHGIDEAGREILDFIEGEVVHPEHDDLVASDDALAAVATAIRQFHDAVSDFDGGQFAWSDRGSDPSGSTEILCHNDLAPWNLIRTREDNWVFIDWDLAAPGRRVWDIAWAVLSLVPLMPGHGLGGRDDRRRLSVFREAYGAAELPSGVIEVAVERCRHEGNLIATRGAAGDSPYDRLLAEGHAQTWQNAATHIAEHAAGWRAALDA